MQSGKGNSELSPKNVQKIWKERVKLIEKDKEFVEKGNCQEQSESTVKRKHPVIKIKHSNLSIKSTDLKRN